MVRADKNDQVYKTREGKWQAVVSEIAKRHEEGQPVLVGTISVEVSELLCERLRQRGIRHTVLNAKPEHAEREGEIVAEAGRSGAVTIATNMAGRGVDIKLGGNAEHLAELELAKLGLKPGDPDYQERMIRWIQASVWLPFMRVHGYQSRTEPWEYSPETERRFRAAIAQREALQPYILEQAGKVWKEDYTLMRPLVFDFPKDERALQQDCEWMFGADYLVCPVTAGGVSSWEISRYLAVY
jgi:preprotein translocase subunit SecA